MKLADNFDYELGIVQGRLTPTEKGKLQNFPNENWSEEFVKASNLNLNFIELLSETVHNPNNPIWNKIGHSQINDISKKFNKVFNRRNQNLGANDLKKSSPGMG